MGSPALKLAYAEQLLVFGNIPDELQPEFGIAYHYDDEPDIRHAIRCVIKPYFARWDDESKTEARKVFAEILMSGQTVWLKDAWESDLPPVDLPNEPLRFVQIPVGRAVAGSGSRRRVRPGRRG